ncbi:hypothetical protein BDN70DRAFT_891673 [Pholiota conissans]|uniref:Uncharacterized protein n=1 Tax=Pholiota conissans TaxID=109636 RepID=A0A9P5Z8I9_9AGAR|nr:hypothetical protein BDN70DRAFT_891673 [Pholiota conissans]
MSRSLPSEAPSNSRNETPLVPTSTGTSSSSGKSRSPSVKPPNVFSNDDLLSAENKLQEEDDKKKVQEALERKLNFADRFKQRGKRRLSTPEPLHDSENSAQDGIAEPENTPQKKRKLSAVVSSIVVKDVLKNAEGKVEDKDTSAQAEYHKAMDSYPNSLKDGGNGLQVVWISPVLYHV